VDRPDDPNRPTAADPGGTDVRVELGTRSYAIRVTTGGTPEGLADFLREALRASWAGRSSRTALVVTDENVAPQAAPVLEALAAAGLEATTSVLPPGEGTKSLDRAADLFDVLIRRKADRHTLVVALGGGVMGDLAGFVAATFARGLPLFMVPTSLLAQVDSSVGGKVGVNHPRAKNCIGAFHQPIGVWVDTTTLATLPDRELRCGLAEVVKYGVILDAEFLESLERRADAILGRDPAALRHVVARSCELKAQVVTVDEREETGLRAVLNFGHTIGHAIEATAGYGGAFLHGEAVAAGMVLESRLAERLGWIGPDVTGRLVALLARFGLPTTATGLDPVRLVEAMGRDKKNRGGAVRFVLPRRMGHVELTADATLDDVRAVLREASAGAAPPA
jgi:3-dehydroquinate synthase